MEEGTGCDSLWRTLVVLSCLHSSGPSAYGQVTETLKVLTARETRKASHHRLIFRCVVSYEAFYSVPNEDVKLSSIGRNRQAHSTCDRLAAPERRNESPFGRGVDHALVSVASHFHRMNLSGGVNHQIHEPLCGR